MLYSNTEYNVVYVDPSIGTAGDGATPATALNALPATADALAENTCYLIRRTDGSACGLPSGTNNSLKRLLLMGMPFPSDPMYAFVPAEAKAAWGPDTARYANIRATSGSQSLSANQLECLLLHRLNMARSGVSSVSAYMIVSYQTSESKGVFTIDKCRFGVEGIDVDDEHYGGGAYTQNAMDAYVRIGQARMLNLRDCVVNRRPTSSYYGIYCNAPDILNVTGCRVNLLACQDSDFYGSLSLSNSQRGQIEATISDLSARYLLDGRDGRYFDSVLRARYFPSLRASGISATTGDLAPDEHPEGLSLRGSLLDFSEANDFSVKGVEASLPHIRRIESPVVRVGCQLCNSHAGCEKTVEDVRISLGGEDSVGSWRNYDETRRFDSYYSLLYVENYNYDRTSCYPKAAVAKGLRLSNPRGNSLFASGCRVTDAVLEGAACLSGCLADIDSISTWFPGYALRLNNYSHARIGEITVNTENTEYPYNSDVVVQCCDGEYSGNAYVGRCNVPLCPVQLSTSAGDTHVARACGNAGETGHYTMLSRNVAADTWNVHRTGGAAACLKIRNDACDTGNTMTIGRKPFRGLLLTPSATGRHVLRMHAAFKGFDSLDALQRRLVVTATVDEGGSPRVYTSSSDGQWRDDPGAEWVNDTDLVQKVLEIPLDISTLSAVDVRIHYGWYSATGFAYIDPAMELVAQE